MTSKNALSLKFWISDSDVGQLKGLFEGGLKPVTGWAFPKSPLPSPLKWQQGPGPDSEELRPPMETG